MKDDAAEQKKEETREEKMAGRFICFRSCSMMTAPVLLVEDDADDQGRLGGMLRRHAAEDATSADGVDRSILVAWRTRHRAGGGATRRREAAEGMMNIIAAT